MSTAPSIFLVFFFFSSFWVLFFVWWRKKTESEYHSQRVAAKKFEAVLLSIIERQIGEHFDFQKVLESLISLVDDSLEHTSASYTLALPGEKLVIGVVIETEARESFVDEVRRLMLVSLSNILDKDITQWERNESVVGNLSLDAQQQTVGSYFHIPIIMFGQPTGVLTIATSKKNRYHLGQVQSFYESLKKFLETLSRVQSLIGTEDSNHAKMEREFRRRMYQTEVLKELSERIGYSLDLTKIIEIITGSVGQLLDYHVIAYVVESHNKVMFKCEIQEPVNHGFVRDIKEKMLASFSMMLGRTFKEDEIDESVSGAIMSEEYKDTVNSFFHLPLIIGGRAVGLITVASPKPNLYNEEETAVLYTIANQASTAVSRLNEVLEREKGKLNSLVTSLNDGIVMFDPHWNVLVINTAARQLLGISGEIVGIYDVFDKLSGKIDIRTQVEKAISSNAAIPSSVIALGDLTLQIVILRVQDKDSQNLGVVVVFHDITQETNARQIIEQKAAELEMANNNIEKQRDRAESILRFLRSIGESVFATNLKGEIIFMNDAAEVLSGKSFSVTEGNRYSEVFLFEDEQGQSIFRSMLEAVLKRSEKVDFPEKVFFVSSSGKKIPVTGSSAPILDDKGVIQGSITVFQDVTKKRELELMKERFLTVAAHQLRTPLGSIRWGIELLEGGDLGILPDAAKEVVKELQKNSQRIVAIVDELLKMSDTANEKPLLPAEKVNVAELLQELIPSFTNEATQKSITIDLQLPPKLLAPVIFDRERLVEIIRQLLSNALRYGREKGHITLTMAEEQETLILSVRDTGIGIPEADQSKIFSKFFRASNAVRFFTDASGLGLSMVKSYLEEGGGSISFESEENVGTTFVIRLPLVKH